MVDFRRERGPFDARRQAEVGMGRCRVAKIVGRHGLETSVEARAEFMRERERTIGAERRGAESLSPWKNLRLATPAASVTLPVSVAVVLFSNVTAELMRICGGGVMTV